MWKKLMTLPMRKASTSDTMEPPPPQNPIDSSSMELLGSQLSHFELDDTEEQRMKFFLLQKTTVGELSEEDFENCGDLGAGDCSIVFKALHKPSNITMARKIIYLDVKLRNEQNILQDLKILDECNSPFIVGFYGVFYSDICRKISICTQYMDGGSLDQILKRYGKIPENVLGKVTSAVLKGLAYLMEKHNIIHRDVKPSNMLVNSRGDIKLCDFGVSGQLTSSAVGIRSYTPERLQGHYYCVGSDIWSIGLSLVEMALGVYPVSPTPLPPNISSNETTTQSAGGGMGGYELFRYIITKAPPKLPPGRFSQEFQDIVNRCMQKHQMGRVDLYTLMSHSWVRRWENENVDIAGWVQKTLKSPTCSKIKSCKCKQLTTIWEEDEFVPPFPPTDKPDFFKSIQPFLCGGCLK